MEKILKRKKALKREKISKRIGLSLLQAILFSILEVIGFLTICINEEHLVNLMQYQTTELIVGSIKLFFVFLVITLPFITFIRIIEK